MTYEQKLDSLLSKIKSVLLAKHLDYGEENLKRHGLFGIVVRLDDKLARVNNILKSSHVSVKHETLEDTFVDIAGYAIQALLMYGSDK